MTNNRYNGWTNYATWRINLEILQGQYEELKEYDSDDLKSHVEELLYCENELAESYAMSFISDVNWYELEEHIHEYNKELEELES
jgi:hypothetical protein